MPLRPDAVFVANYLMTVGLMKTADENGDPVLVRDDHHPIVAGYGYNVYCLNCLAWSARQLATTEDPDHLWVRSTWTQVDPRVPMVGGSGI